ncbi:MAG: glutamyl-tRNA reductase [Bacillota bacterium]|jgi:glutamyl-tRNA reductase
MQIVVVGLNHDTSPVAVRERLAFSESALPDALDRLRTKVQEGFLLSTCNRTEVYAFAGHAESGSQHLTRFLAKAGGLTAAELESFSYTHAHDAAVRHLFRVAAGLDSMVLGDDQIVAQLKGALDSARRADALGPVLGRLGDAALATAKRVRTTTAIGRTPVSVVSIAVQAAESRLGGLRGVRVAVVGAGRIASTAVQHLDGSGAAVTVVGRDAARTELVATTYRVAAAPWSALAATLGEADVVISCTSAPDVVIDRAMVESACRNRPSRPLFCLDLAVPRDIDPSAASLAGVTLLDMDALNLVATANRSQRALELGDAEVIVSERTERFMDWWRGREVVPAITQLRARADAIRDAELERALARLPELSEHDQLVVRTLAARIVNKLLHHPITTLKDDPEGANMARIVQYLFGLLPAASACLTEMPRPDHTHEAGLAPAEEIL